MRLSTYPHVVLRLACRKCPRRGQYRTVRLAERHGAEMPLSALREVLSADCELRQGNRLDIYRQCGVFYPDLADPKPADMPARQEVGSGSD